MNDSQAITGIILSGGASRRMGRDKGGLPWGNTTILQHLVATLSAYLRPCIVVGQPEQSSPSLGASIIFTPDEVAYQGPLAGFLTGLRLVPPTQPIFLTGCDFPFVTPQLIRLLHDQIQTADAIVLEHEQELQPMPALYSPKVVALVASLYKDGERSLKALFKTLTVKRIPQSTWRKRTELDHYLTNINTPIEYEQAHARYLATIFSSDSACNPANHQGQPSCE